MLVIVGKMEFIVRRVAPPLAEWFITRTTGQMNGKHAFTSAQIGSMEIGFSRFQDGFSHGFSYRIA
jgi:hypothetical protein